jgi:hypothetical protein
VTPDRVLTPARAATRTIAILLALVALLGPAGSACTVREPDVDDWRSLARLSLTDAASEAATMELMLRQVRAGRLPTRYAEVMAADSEKAVGTAEDRLSTVQPPDGRAEETDRLLDLIARAAHGVRAARAVVVGDRPIEDALLRRLARTASRLERQAATL